MKDYYFYFLSGGFISAIFISSFASFGITFSFLLIFISITFFIYCTYFILDEKTKPVLLLISIFILFFGIGILRYEINSSRNVDKNLESNIGKIVIIDGLVKSDPNRTERNTQFILDIQNVSSSTASGKILVIGNIESELSYGDQVRIHGKLELPENFASSASSSREFDYINYLAKDGIYYRMNANSIAVISRGNLNAVKLRLLNVKKSFEGKINSLIPKKEAGLLNGILLGDKSGISKDMMTKFQISGIPHIVVLSGYNITVVAKAIDKLLSSFPRMFGHVGGVIGIILFVLMTGATSTSIRAAIMAIIALFAKMQYRNYTIGRALLVAGFLMVFINPKILVFDISFQLSFFATLAIIYISPIVGKKLQFITEKFGLRDIVSSTIAAQIMVLPLILYKMGLLSFVSLPTNILILPFIPLTMLLGFSAGLFGYFLTPIAILFSWMTDFFLVYIIHISNFFAGLPFSYVMVNYFPAWVMVLLYGIIIWMYIKMRKVETEE